MKIARMGLLVGGLLVLGACGRGENNAAVNEVGDTMGMGLARSMPAAIDTARQTRGVEQPTHRVRKPAKTAALSDAQIVAVLMAGDSAEIGPSQLALRRASDARLKVFARRMITEHGMLEDSLRALLRTLKMTAAASPMSTEAMARASDTMRELEALSDTAFDAAYASAMLRLHERALNTIDHRLLPAVQNGQLKRVLEQTVRPMVEAHLKQIGEIRSVMGMR